MVAIGGLLAAAAIGTWHIGWAYLGAWLGWPRPESLKPFFETLGALGRARPRSRPCARRSSSGTSTATA